MTATRKISILALAAALLALLALPAGAAAEYYVPPSNSAANQYTETVPSAGGNKGGKDKGRPVTVAEALGAKNAKRLENEGPEGKAAAELAAETAPTTESTVTGGSGGLPGGGQGGGGQGTNPSAGGSGNASGGNQAGGGAGSGAAPVTEEPSGSSALGEIVRQATGSGEDGNLGLWLPLAIIAILGGSIAYGVRHRDRTA